MDIPSKTEGLEEGFLLIKLSPEQVSNSWDDIKEAIKEALPPTEESSPETLSRALNLILSDQMHCWGIYENGKLKGLMTTVPVVEGLAGVKKLLIYSLYSYETLSIKSYFAGLAKLREFAKSIGCSGIVAYSRNEVIERIVKILGGDVSYKYINLGV